MQSQSSQTAPLPLDSPTVSELQLYKEPSEPNDFDSAGFEDSGSLPQSLIDAFAQATGWELARVGDRIKIVDMSSTWPAKTPTCHRGNCDRVAEELSKLLS